MLVSSEDIRLTPNLRTDREDFPALNSPVSMAGTRGTPSVNQEDLNLNINTNNLSGEWTEVSGRKRRRIEFKTSSPVVNNLLSVGDNIAAAKTSQRQPKRVSNNTPVVKRRSPPNVAAVTVTIDSNAFFICLCPEQGQERNFPYESSDR